MKQPAEPMQDTVTAAGSLPRLRDELANYVLGVTLPPGASAEFYAALARVTDRAAYYAVEETANALLADTTPRAFVLGWECGRDPDRLIFKP